MLKRLKINWYFEIYCVNNVFLKELQMSNSATPLRHAKANIGVPDFWFKP
jgi:hypothetical protein